MMAEPQSEPPPAPAKEYFVVSMGWETRLYEEFLPDVTDLSEVVVDVRDYIEAPPPEERIKPEIYPDASMVARIHAHKDFDLVVEKMHRDLTGSWHCRGSLQEREAYGSDNCSGSGKEVTQCLHRALQHPTVYIVRCDVATQ